MYLPVAGTACLHPKNIEAPVNSLLTKKIRSRAPWFAPASAAAVCSGVRFHLVTHTSDGTASPDRGDRAESAAGGRHRDQAAGLQAAVLRDRAFPASIEATGDIRIAGTIYADLIPW